MSPRSSMRQLGSREREIMEVVYRRKEASVQEVLNELEAPPSYSSVRTMLRHLEKKGLLKHRQDGTRYLYRPVESIAKTRRAALKDVLENFFRGSPADAMAAIIDLESKRLSEDDLKRLETMIREARKRGE